MSKLNVNVEKVSYDIIPRLNNDYNSLNTVYNKINGFNVPSDFSYKTELDNAISMIGILKENIKNVKNKINDALTKIKKLESNNKINGTSYKFNSVNNQTFPGMLSKNFNGGKPIGNNNTDYNFNVMNEAVFNPNKEIIDKMNINKKNNNDDILFKMMFDRKNHTKNLINFNEEKEEKTIKKKNVFDYIGESYSKIYGAALFGNGGIVDTYSPVVNGVSDGLKTYGEGWKALYTDPNKSFTQLKDNWVSGFDLITSNPERSWSSVGSAGAAFTGGMISFGESVLDGLYQGGALVVSKPLLFVDSVGYIFGQNLNLTGQYWDNYIKPVVAHDIRKDVSDFYYSFDGTKIMNDKSSLKKDSNGYKTVEQIGYTGASILATGGVSYVAAPGTSVVASTAGTAAENTARIASGISGVGAFGRYTSEEWNKNSIDVSVGGNDLKFDIDYTKLKQIQNLKTGNSTTVKQNFYNADGSSSEIILTIKAIGNSKYKITDQNGNEFSLKNLEESNTGKGLLVGFLKGAKEGAQYYIGAKVNAAQFDKITRNITNPVTKEAVKSGIRVAADAASGATDVPFNTVLSVGVYNKTWNEAWNENGGLDTMMRDIGMGAGFSALSEVPNITSTYKGTKISNKINTEGFTPKTLNDISKLKGNSLKAYVEEGIKNGTFENTYKYINKQELNNIESMFNPKDLQKITGTKMDYKIHIEDNILTSNLKDKITQEQLEYMKNLKGDDLEAFMMKASQVGKLKDVMNYLDAKEIKKISTQIKDIKSEEKIKNIPNSKEVATKEIKHIDSSPIKQGESSFDIIKKYNPDVRIFNSFEEFSKFNEKQRMKWMKQMKKNKYICPITGEQYTYEQLIIGYTGESLFNSFDRIGNYKYINHINRLLSEAPDNILENLYLREPNGNIIRNSIDGCDFIQIGGTPLKYNSLTDMVTNPTGNGFLPNGKSCTLTQLIEKVKHETDALNKALNLCTIDEPMVIGRGVDMNFLEKYGVSKTDSAQQIYSKLTKDGNVLVDDGFMSCTAVEDGGFMRTSDVNLIITTKEGTPIGDLSNYNATEKEVLLPAGCKFEIQGVKINENNNHIIVYLQQL